jgi:hypothetical protein
MSAVGTWLRDAAAVARQTVREPQAFQIKAAEGLLLQTAMILLVWPPAEHLWIGRNRGNSCLTAIAARWLMLVEDPGSTRPRAAFRQRRSSNANSLCGQNSAGFLRRPRRSIRLDVSVALGPWLGSSPERSSRSALNRRMSAARCPGSGFERTSAKAVRNPPASVSGNPV